MTRITFAVALLLVAATANARCLTTISTSDDVRTKMDEAHLGGCSIYFEAGDHSTTSRLGYNFVGTANDPIVIYGDSASTTRLLRPDANQNLMDLSGQYFVVRGLELEGGSKGIRLEASVANAAFTHLVIHGTADSAFTANATGQSYTNLTISHSEFYDTAGTGECLYLGCNNNSCTMGDSQVSFNYCHDTGSSFGASHGEGIDLKGGAFNVTIRHNVIRDTHGPGIMTFANAGGPQNVIEGNAVMNPGGVGIQFTGDSILRNNVIHMADAGIFVGINGSADSQGVPNNVQIQNNTVVNTTGNTDNDCIALRGWDEAATNMVVANNAFYCNGGRAMYMFPGGSQSTIIVANAVEGTVENVPSGTFDGGTAADQFEGVNSVNLFPKHGSLLVGAGGLSQSPDHDLNCRRRNLEAADVGAFNFDQFGNRGWEGSQNFISCDPIVFVDGFEN